MMKRSFVSVVAALLVLLMASASWAAPTWKEKREAQKLAAQGRYHVQRGEFEKAAKKYRKADRLTPSVLYKVEVAKLLIELEDLVQAGAILDEAIELKPHMWNEKRAQRSATRLREEVAERTPSLKIRVKDPSPDLVNVTVDGESFEPSEGAVPYNPGTYEVVATADGYETWRKDVKLREGDKKKLKVSLSGGKALPGEEEEDEGGGGLSPIPAYISWGIGGAGLAVGIGFGIAAIQTTNDVLKLYDCEDGQCPKEEAEEDLNVALVNGDLSTAGFIIGGVGVVTGTVLFLLSGDDDEEGAEGDEEDGMLSIEAKPILGPGFVGMSGTF